MAVRLGGQLTMTNNHDIHLHQNQQNQNNTMILCHTTKEVSHKLMITREAVVALGEILRVPKMSNCTQLWTDHHIEKARKILEYGRREITSLEEV